VPERDMRGCLSVVRTHRSRCARVAKRVGPARWSHSCLLTTARRSRTAHREHLSRSINALLRVAKGLAVRDRAS
jgi:hypothetical protein